MDDDLKTVLVEVDSLYSAGEVDSFEVDFWSDFRAGKSDVSLIIDQLKSKGGVIADSISASHAVFKRESLKIPGKMVVIGDKSPIMNGSTLKCFLRPKIVNTITLPLH